MSRIGVLGGTFDPPHYGHLRAAEVVREALMLDEVLFVPAASPPHKVAPEVTEADHRVSMVERVLARESHFRLSRIEVMRGGPSYTIDTLGELSKSAQEDRMFFITGADAFVEIRTWMRWEELVSTYDFVIHERPGFRIDEALRVLPRELGARAVEVSGGWSDTPEARPAIHVVRRPMLGVSSTEIRSSVREKHSIRFLVPDTVEEYIRFHRLYQ